MAAGCGTPIRGPWAGLETCELPPVGGGASAVAVLWPRSEAARAGASRAVRPGAGAGRAHHGPSGACAGRGRPRPGAGRARAGAAGMATRDQVGLLARRHPAATAEVSGRHTRAADCNKRGINSSSCSFNGLARAAPGRGAPTRPGRTRSCAPVAGRGGGGGGVSMGNEAVSAERGRWAQGRAGDRASREAGRRCPGTPRVAHPVRPGQCASAARLNVSSE